MIAFGPVKSALKLLLISAMLALIPLRGLAALTVGICAAGNQEWNQAQVVHDHGSHERGAAPESNDDQKNADCSNCAEHCAGASFVPQATLTALPDGSGGDRVPPGERFAAGHVPEHLDPPPLAL